MSRITRASAKGSANSRRRPIVRRASAQKNAKNASHIAAALANQTNGTVRGEDGQHEHRHGVNGQSFKPHHRPLVGTSQTQSEIQHEPNSATQPDRGHRAGRGHHNVVQDDLGQHAPCRQDVSLALYTLDPSLAGDEAFWLQVGQALYSWNPGEATRELWEKWSASSEAPRAANCRERWAEFGNQQQTASFTIDDLFEWAGRQLGRKSRRRRSGATGGAWNDALEFVESRYLTNVGESPVLTLRNYRGEFYEWDQGRYALIPVGQIRNAVIRFLGARNPYVNSNWIAAVLDCLRAMTEVPPHLEAPCWLGDDEFGDSPATRTARPKPEDLIPVRNGLVDVPKLLAGQSWRVRPTPRFFNLDAIALNFGRRVPRPTRWHAFLDELWPNDPESIATLREWCGYLVMRRTDLQKILMVIGVPRSGKGTIAKVTSALVGEGSSVSRKLTDFALNFGLAPLLGKSLCIVPDARLSNRHDEATLVERLLSISGEDFLTIDRKYLEPVTGKLAARIMILANEIPNWADTSGALSSRLILLTLKKSFRSPADVDPAQAGELHDPLGVADPQLWPKLKRELPAILLWALKGWGRLQQRGHFLQPESGRPLLREAVDLASPVGMFVRDECRVAKDARISVPVLYERWTDYCRANGLLPGSVQMFCRDLRAVVPHIQTERRKLGRITTRALIGISSS
jgi:P4 family phage/plasmid primase-like protien